MGDGRTACGGRPALATAVALAAGIAAGGALGPGQGRAALAVAAVVMALATAGPLPVPGCRGSPSRSAWACWAALALGLARAPAVGPAVAPGTTPAPEPPPGLWVVEGLLVDHARPAGEGVRFVLRVDAARPAGVGRPPAGFGPPRRVLVYAPAGQEAPPGWLARVRVTGTWRALPGYENPGAFGYPAYLRRLGVGLSLRAVGRPEPAGGAAGWALGALRARMDAALRRGAGPRAGLLAGLALGDASALSEQQRDLLQAAGLAHAVAASGLNVGVVAWLAGRAARRLGPVPHAAAVLAGTAGYVVLVGPAPSLLRAAVFLCALRVARACARPPDALNALGAAASLLLLLDPAALYDLGLQLSFLAVAGIAVLLPPGRQVPRRGAQGDRLRRLARAWGHGALAAVAAQLAVLPVLAANWGEVSLVAPASNLLVLPLLTALLPAALLAAVAGAAWLPLGSVLAAGAAVPAGWAEALAGALATLPGARQVLPPLPPWLVAAYYLALGLVLADWRHEVQRRRLPRPRRAWPWLTAVLTTAAVLAAARAQQSPRVLEIAFLDVGQGDAIVIRAPPGLTAVVDAGESPGGRPLAAERAVIPFLRARGVGAVDILVASHYDADHAGGLAVLARAFPVGMLLVPAPGTAADAADRALARRLAEAPARVRVQADRAQRLPFGAALLEVLPPPPEGMRGNDASLAVRVCYAGRSLLLTGDAGLAREEAWLRQGVPLRAEVLKVAHHGSGTGTGAALLRQVRPALAVVQVGRRNRYGLPHAEVLARLAAAGVRVLRTDRDGGVLVRIDPDGGLSVRTARGTWVTLSRGGGWRWRSWASTRRCAGSGGAVRIRSTS